jgi:hypothetical protein
MRGVATPRIEQYREYRLSKIKIVGSRSKIANISSNLKSNPIRLQYLAWKVPVPEKKFLKTRWTVSLKELLSQNFSWLVKDLYSSKLSIYHWRLLEIVDTRDLLVSMDFCILVGRSISVPHQLSGKIGYTNKG